MFGSRAVVLVFHMDERLAHRWWCYHWCLIEGESNLFQRFTVTLEPELGSVRAIDWETGGQVFLSGQDRHLVVWSLENGAEERRIATGLVVALVVTQGLAITAGSLQVPSPSLYCSTHILTCRTSGFVYGTLIPESCWQFMETRPIMNHLFCRAAAKFLLGGFFARGSSYPCQKLDLKMTSLRWRARDGSHSHPLWQQTSLNW